MRQHNKYVEALGLKVREVGINWKPDYHNILTYWRRKKQRLECGYDERITYNLDEYAIEQIYAWLNMYLENAYSVVDLDFHKFEFEGRTYTEFEAIVYIMYHIEEWIKFEADTKNWDIDKETILCNNVQKALHMFAEIIWALWW